MRRITWTIEDLDPYCDCFEPRGRYRFVTECSPMCDFDERQADRDAAIDMCHSDLIEDNYLDNEDDEELDVDED